MEIPTQNVFLFSVRMRPRTGRQGVNRGTYMVWIDYAIMAVLGLSCLVSLIRGFVREALSFSHVGLRVLWSPAIYYADLSVWVYGL